MESSDDKNNQLANLHIGSRWKLTLRLHGKDLEVKDSYLLKMREEIEPSKISSLEATSYTRDYEL